MASVTHTVIHTLVERCRANDYPAVVARLESGWVVMGEQQVLPGYCLLLPDPVVAHLNDLTADARTRFLSDMALVGDALLVSAAAVRINYAVFGNVEPALHAHVFPRRASEPVETRTAQPWAFDWRLAPRFEPAVHGDLQRTIAAQIAALVSGPVKPRE